MSDPGFKWADIGPMLDQIICECGWESATYFDGQEYAYDRWKKHVAKDHPALKSAKGET